MNASARLHLDLLHATDTLPLPSTLIVRQIVFSLNLTGGRVLTAKEAQVRTTCEVFIETDPISSVSPDCRDLSVRAYTRLAGEMTPAANQHCMESPRDVFFR